MKYIGRLPVNVNYQVIGIDYQSLEDNAGACDNCGKIISNMATIKNEAGAIYTVGLDCASTMQLYKNDAIFNLIEAKKELARRAKFVKWVRTSQKEGKFSIVKSSGTREDGTEWAEFSFYHRAGVTEWAHYWKYRMSEKFFYKTYPGLSNIISL